MIESLGKEEGLEDFAMSNKTTIVDADTVVYAACSVCEYAEDLLGWEMYTEEEMLEIQDTPGYDEAEHCIWKIDIEQAVQHSEKKLLEIKAATNTNKMELYFTEGRNFRYDVFPMYKANRKRTRYPQGMGVVKRALLEKYKGKICTTYEADDICVTLVMASPEKYILACVDKDLIGSVPHRVFNYYSSIHYNIDMKWVETSARDAYQFPYKQCLMGDSTDNIQGVPGIGPKKAEKALEGLVTPCDMWKAVVKLFKSKKLTVKDAIMTMRLVHMQQLIPDGEGDYIVNLWQPPCDTESK